VEREDALVLRQSADLAVDRERVAERDGGVTESVTGSQNIRRQPYECSRVVCEIFWIRARKSDGHSVSRCLSSFLSNRMI
jgi:hypothetical protein